MADVRGPLTGNLRKDGRWCITITLTRDDGAKIKKTLYAGTQREVQAEARKYIYKYGRKATDPHTMSELLAECRAQRWNALSENTQAQYNLASKRIEAHFKQKDVRDIATPTVATWLKSLATVEREITPASSKRGKLKAEGKGDPKPQKLSGRGIQIHRNVLRVVMKFGEEIGWIDQNPVTDALRLPVSAKPMPRRRLTYMEARAIVDAEKDVLRRLYWWTLMESGLRPNEASALTKEQIQYSQDCWWIRVGSSKTEAGENRMVMIGDALGKALYEVDCEDGPIFGVLKFANAGDRRNMYRRWEHACKNAGVPYTNLYQLRKLRVAMWMAAGVSDQVVQEMVGHTSIELTKRVYDQVTRDRIRKSLVGEN